MKTITSLLLAMLLLQAQAQDSATHFTFKEIGWTISLPAALTPLDSAENNKKIERGKNALEQSNDIIADISGTKTLFSATKNTFQYITATITPFNPQKDGNYIKVNKEVQGILYNTVKKQMPEAQIDSSSAVYTVDGLNFFKFSITIKMKGLLMNMVLLSKLYKGYDFGISYLYLDEKTREQMESAIAESKFRK